MRKFGQAQPAGRIEDLRFLTGAGRYVDDLAPRDALFAAFLRSPHAAGRIGALDLDAARAMPGVQLVLDAAGLEGLGVTLGLRGAVLTNADGSRAAAPERPALARGRVCFAGEPVAVVVADTLAQARDAVEAIGLEIDDTGAALALDAGAPAVHPEAPDNCAYDWAMGDAGAVQAALAASAHRVTLEVVHNRVTAASLEPRAAFAEWDGARLHLCVNAQGVWTQKAELARQLGLDAGQVRVTNPDVGGGFGMKVMTYPEYVAIGAAARALGRAVRWASDRGEAMLSDNGARDLVAVAELGFDRDLKITAYRVDVKSNMGAYNSQFGQNIQSVLFSKVLTGPYDIQTAHLRARGFYTHTAPVDAYRGAGRPEAILTLERVLDHAARVLGADPFEIRLRNVIRQTPYRMVNGEIIDSGDFARVLNRLRAEADVAGWPARVAVSRAAGRMRGRGLAAYVESVLGDPSETARLTLEAGGGATLYVGTQSNGQGHETVYTRLLAAQTGLPEAAIRIVQGDSDAVPKGGGTGGSRSVTVQGTAIRAVAEGTIEAFCQFLSQDQGLPAVSFDDGHFGAPGSNLRLTLAEAADLARDRGRPDLCDQSRTIRLAQRSFPNGAHLAEVEVDPETGQVRLDRYTVTDDFGTLIAPQLVEGQVHGGIAQGFGQAVTEHTVYDHRGQLLTGSFMDYAMPRAADLCPVRFTTEPAPTPSNPLGMKGCGEAGTVGALAAVTNAALDAVWDAGVRHVDMPLTPVRVWSWLQAVRQAAE
ncbi:MAG TPA: xanthine dehydrogenase family protein molybdopterin-binding subunit [Paracoccaceae bacterium]|nr:xanthine dehydrogenase family protein molybdopterin-binding subunit [Paracoccaceae bacterium]